jgi:hypothetical protein
MSREPDRAEVPAWLADPYFKLKPYPRELVETCGCTDTPAMVLTAAFAALGGANPLRCLRCNSEIAPESLALSAAHVDAIAHWNSVAGAIEWLELDSGAYEGWARAQLVDPKSTTNVEGLALARELNTLRPCYFSFFVAMNEDLDYLTPSRCPLCGDRVTVPAQWPRVTGWCERDRIVFFN